MSSKKVDSLALVERVHTVLREKFALEGHGSIRRTEQELGLYDGYYKISRKRAKMDLGVLFATLKVLAVDPVDFFTEVLRGEEGESEPMALMDPEIGEITEQVIDIAKRRAKEELGVDLEEGNGGD